MTKFTPGPWRAGTNLGCKTIGAGKSGRHKQAQWAREVAFTSGLAKEAEDRANARLIAAAPDLYAALEMVRDADNDCRSDGFKTIPAPARAKIDAALALAVAGKR